MAASPVYMASNSTFRENLRLAKTKSELKRHAQLNERLNDELTILRKTLNENEARNEQQFKDTIDLLQSQSNVLENLHRQRGGARGEVESVFNNSKLLRHRQRSGNNAVNQQQQQPYNEVTTEQDGGGGDSDGVGDCDGGVTRESDYEEDVGDFVNEHASSTFSQQKQNIKSCSSRPSIRTDDYNNKLMGRKMSFATSNDEKQRRQRRNRDDFYNDSDEDEVDDEYYNDDNDDDEHYDSYKGNTRRYASNSGNLFTLEKRRRNSSTSRRNNLKSSLSSSKKHHHTTSSAGSGRRLKEQNSTGGIRFAS